LQLKPEDKVYWLKFVTAIVIGYLSAYLSTSIEMASITAVLIFLAALAYVVVSNVLARAFIQHENLTKRNIYLNGLGTYIGTFLVSWIIFYNMLLLV